MDESSLLQGVLSVLILLGLALGVDQLSRWAKIPFAVGLLLGGIIVGNLGIIFSWDLINAIQFSPGIVFYVLLPTLIFESAYHLNLRNLRKVLPEVLSLAVIGLLISIGLISWALHTFLDLPWPVSLLFGALISATDPVAVLAIFREMRVPQKMATLIDSESLFNDGTALVIFQFIYKIVILGFAYTLSPSFVALEAWYFFGNLVTGVGLGIGFGVLFSLLMLVFRQPLVQLSLSLILAHATFILSESVFHASGILATLMAGLIVGNYGILGLKKASRETFHQIWQFMGFVTNGLIFLLLGIQLSQVQWLAHLDSILVASVVTLVLARPVSVLVSIGWTNVFRSPAKKWSLKSQGLFAWAGIRGALAAAAVLLIPPSFPYADQLQAMTGGVILTTFLLNALSMKTVLRFFAFNRYTNQETMQQYEAHVLMGDKMDRYVTELKDKKYISGELHERIQQQYAVRLEEQKKALAQFETTCPHHKREVQKMLARYALSIERQVYQDLYDHDEIDGRRFYVLQGSIERQLDWIQEDVLPEERHKNANIAPNIPVWDKLSCISNYIPKSLVKNLFCWYQRRQIICRWLHYRARRIASWQVMRYFETLLSEHQDLTHQSDFEKIIQRYARWHHNALAQVQKLEDQYPKALDGPRLQMVEKLCQKKEHEIEYAFWKSGLIDQKVYDDLEEKLQWK